MNTPSHHRVHHGIDPQYVDRNYAGIFIVWDRLFGTYEPEDREPVYGTVKPVPTLEPARRQPAALGGPLRRCRLPPDPSQTRCASGLRLPSGVRPISGVP